ncbi:MAG: prolipoprotein diacylglyceryl transferase [Myxococcales bacterium]|nr:prolipoprotein diacylglyceryl transferase [Myxococcales bacterium]
MYPVLFRVGEVAIYSYGVMMIAALGAGFVAVLLAAMRLRYSVAAAAVMGCLIPVPMLLGAKVGWWLINSEQISRQTGWMSGGLSLTPGLLAALACAALVTLAFKQPLGASLDVAVIGLASAVSVGRFGCFLAGCCFGRPTELPWGLVLPESGLMPEAFHGARLHPTQLYLLGAFALLAAGVSWRGLRRRFAGELTLVAVATYGVVSVFDPFVRYSETEPSVGSRIGWAAVVVIAITLIVVLARRPSLVTAARPL